MLLKLNFVVSLFVRQGALRGFKPGDLLTHFIIRLFKTAMHHGHINILHYMVQHGFNVKHVGLRSLLHQYAQQGNSDPSPGNNNSRTGPPYNLKALDFLLSAGFDVDTSDKHTGYRTPLHFACHFGRLPLVLVLLHHKADANAVAKGGVTPLQLALASAAKVASNPKADEHKIVLLMKVGFFDDALLSTVGIGVCVRVCAPGMLSFIATH